MTRRAPWDSARAIIERHTGPVRTVRHVSEGLNSEIAVVVNGSTFVKGLRTGHPRAWTQDRERLVNPHIRHVSAPLYWSAEESDWYLLGFGTIDGRRADYSPGCVDLPLIVSTINAIGKVPCPDMPLKLAEERWQNYCKRPGLLAGEALLHTEWNSSNVLISKGSAHVIDWAWSTKGAPWIDAAAWLVFLIAAGRSPAQAERWASQVESYQSAPQAGHHGIRAGSGRDVDRNQRR